MSEESPLEKSKKLLALRAERDRDFEIQDMLREDDEKQQKKRDAESEQLERLRQGRKLLSILPQGPGSGLDADLVDGQHAYELHGGGGGGIGYGDAGLEKTASYIIRIKDSYYEGINGSTGELDFSGTDASAVINAMLNALA